MFYVPLIILLSLYTVEYIIYQIMAVLFNLLIHTRCPICHSYNSYVIRVINIPRLHIRKHTYLTSQPSLDSVSKLIYLLIEWTKNEKRENKRQSYNTTRRLGISETSKTTGPAERNLRAFGSLHRGTTGRSVMCMCILHVHISFLRTAKIRAQP